MTLDTKTIVLHQDNIPFPNNDEFNWSEGHITIVVKQAFDQSDLELGEQKNFRNYGFAQILKKNDFSKAAYIETDSGYFHVSEDMMEHINVTYSRWD